MQSVTLAAALRPFGLERWFAEQPREWSCDLSGSGARALLLDELLALASPAERDEFACSSLGYGPSDGSDTLRALIAQRYPGVRGDDVLVTCGAIEALQLCVSSLVAPGDEVIVQHPMYPAVAGIARALGAQVHLWALDEEREYRADLDRLEGLLTPRTRLVAITQPNNPTGAVLERGDLQRLLDLAGSVGAAVVSDEVCRDLALAPNDVPPAVAGGGMIAVADVTKPFGLGGLRLGWLVTRDAALAQAVRMRRDYSTLSPPTLSDALARIALRHADELLSRAVENLRANLNALDAFADSEHAVSFVRPRAGLTAFVRAQRAPALQRRLAADGILVVPGDLFGAPDHLRLWLGGPVGEFAHALDRLGRHLARP